MKKFFLQLGVAVLVGLIISIGLFFIVQGWTRSDMISVFTLIVAVWTAGVTRWATIPQGELAQRELEKQKREEENRKRGSVDLILKTRSSGTDHLYLVNTGLVDIKNVSCEFEPLEGSEGPLMNNQFNFPLPVVRPKEELLITYVSFHMNSGTAVNGKVKWLDPDGSEKIFEKLIST